MSAKARIASFLCLWGLLVGSRHEVLFLPPGDDQCGYWIEADFLYDTHFDYARLVTHEPHADVGGRRCYVTVLLPTLVALGRVAGLTTESLFVIYHLFSFACGAAMGIAVFEILQKVLGGLASAAVVAAILTAPLFRAQLEFLGTDAAMSSLVTIALVLLAWQRFVAAGFVVLAAFLMKNTAFLGMAAMIGATGLAWLASLKWTSDVRSRTLFMAGFGYSFLLAAALLTFWLGNSIQIRLDQPILVTYILAPFCCPDITLVAIFWAVLSIFTLVRGSIQWRRRQPALFPLLDSTSQLLFAGTTLLAGITLLAGTRLNFHPRYWTILVPCLFISMSIMILIATRRTFIVFSLAAPLALFNLANADGRYFPPLPHDIARLCTFVERSQEYAPPLVSLKAAMAIAEEANREAPVIVSEATYRPASVPAIGFVSAPLDGYTTLHVEVSGMKNVVSILDDRPRKVIVLHLNELFRVDSDFQIPEPDEDDGDRVLYRDSFAQPLIVYEKTFSENAPRSEYVEWLMKFFTLEPSMWILERLLQAGHRDVARRYVQRCQQSYPDEPETRALMERLRR